MSQKSKDSTSTAAVELPIPPPDNLPVDFEESTPIPLANGAVKAVVLTLAYSNSEKLYPEQHIWSLSVASCLSGHVT